MTWNFKQELARKFIHLLSIFILFVYFIVADIFSKQIALIILVLILIIALELEYIRMELGFKIPILKSFWKYVRREKEKQRLGGDIFFLIGSILVLAVFDLRVAIAAILMTTLGDLAAALIGKKFGKNFIMKERSLEGILAEFLVDIAIGFVLFSNSALPMPWIVILVMAITATFVETLMYKMDDNLVIPIFAGFNAQIVILILNSIY